MVDGDTPTKTTTIFTSSDEMMSFLYFGLVIPAPDGAILTIREDERRVWLAERPVPPTYFEKYPEKERMLRCFMGLCRIICEAHEKGDVAWLWGTAHEAWGQLNQLLATKRLPEIDPGTNGQKLLTRFSKYALAIAVREQKLPYTVFNSIQQS